MNPEGMKDIKTADASRLSKSSKDSKVTLIAAID